VYVNNETYQSLPALFGRFMVDGTTYEARLQYFHDNPYLCEVDQKTTRHFVPPTGPQIPVFGGGNVTLYGEPVALLVSRGNCPFQRKAAVAESIHESIKFLLIANFNLDNTLEGEDTLVPMYSQFGNTRLVLLSVSHATGQSLKKYLSQVPANVAALGGPVIMLDSEPPVGMLTAEDLQSMMLSALGLFFMLISFTGCLVILAGTYNQIAAQHGGNPIAAATQRRLLTEDEVNQLTASTDIESHTRTAAPNPSRTTTGLGDAADTRDDDSLEEPEEDQCAVCLGDFDTDSSITALPCHHKFHTDCILPWLTERQSKCPLCKFDVLQHIREQQLVDNENNNNTDTTPTSAASIWDQLRRYRWTSVHGVDDDTEQQQQHGVVVMVESTSNDLRLDEDDHPGVELTEQRILS
jgi:Ring finger domain